MKKRRFGSLYYNNFLEISCSCVALCCSSVESVSAKQFLCPADYLWRLGNALFQSFFLIS